MKSAIFLKSLFIAAFLWVPHAIAAPISDCGTIKAMAMSMPEAGAAGTVRYSGNRATACTWGHMYINSTNKQLFAAALSYSLSGTYVCLSWEPAAPSVALGAGYYGLTSTCKLVTIWVP